MKCHGEGFALAVVEARAIVFPVTEHPPIYVSVTFRFVSLYGHVGISGVSCVSNISVLERK